MYTHTHTHTHAHIIIYITKILYVFVFILELLKYLQFHGRSTVGSLNMTRSGCLFILKIWLFLTLSLLARNVICNADLNSILSNFMYHTLEKVSASNTPSDQFLLIAEELQDFDSFVLPSVTLQNIWKNIYWCVCVCVCVYIYIYIYIGIYIKYILEKGFPNTGYPELRTFLDLLLEIQ